MKTRPHSIFRLLLAAVAMCSGTAVLASTVPASSISPEDAVRDATRIAAMQNGWEVFKTTGDSMLPHYGENSLLLVAPQSFPTLRAGMIVVFRDADGDLVAHQIVSIKNGMAWTKGAFVKNLDPNPVMQEQVLGVVLGVFHASDAINETSLPVVMGKRY